MKVSIGIPVFNEEKNIDNLLNILHKTKFKFDLKEILVVCSGCTDNSVSIVKKFVRKWEKIKFIIEKNRKGKFSAINKILKYSKSDIILFIDADTIPKGDTLNILIESFKGERVGVVTGKAIPIQSKRTIIGRLQNFLYEIHHEVSFSFPKMGNIYAIRNGIIEKIPTKIINDDIYIPLKISQTYSIVYKPKAEIIMNEYYDFKSYMKVRRRIAQGNIQLSILGLNPYAPFRLLLKLAIKKILKEPSKFFYMFLASVIETYSYVMAFYDVKRGKIDYKWEKIN
jgi:cellulose synthase/poly-beta-1,6-N-acetylglucosamine synthase-like glycosyltransferase